MYGYIYLTTNILNNKKYIGKHKGEYNPNYLGSGLVISHAIKKYGKENFKNEVLHVCYSLEELNEMEKYYIKIKNACKSNEYYNIASGGDGGNLIAGYTEEQMNNLRRKLSIANSGENNSMYGKKHSKETLRLLSKKRKEAVEKGVYSSEAFLKKMSEVTSGEKNPMYGRKHTEVSKEKMSKNSKGKTAGNKNGMYGKKGDNAINGRKVNMLDDCGNIIKAFNTKHQALEYLGISGHAGLNDAIRTKKKYKGYYWEQLNKKTNIVK